MQAEPTLFAESRSALPCRLCALDIPDPDATVLRFLAGNPINEGHFLGVDIDAQGRPTVYLNPAMTSHGVASETRTDRA